MVKANTSVTNLGPIGVREILFVWCASMLLWRSLLTNLFPTTTNVEYLQWGVTAVTIVCFSRFTVSRSGVDFRDFLGYRIQRSDLAELTIALFLSIILGIGCWVGLVITEAKIDSKWTFVFWNLISPRAFTEVRWLPEWAIANLIVVTILVPITEEIIFRGIILNRLRSKYKLTTAILLSAFIFALFHIDKSFIGSFCHGIIFAVIAVRFGSLYAPMFVHGLYNAAVSLLKMNLGIFLAVEASEISSFTYWRVELCFMVVGIFLLIIYLRSAAALSGRKSTR